MRCIIKKGLQWERKVFMRIASRTDFGGKVQIEGTMHFQTFMPKSVRPELRNYFGATGLPRVVS